MSATTAATTSTPLLKYELQPIPDPPQAGQPLTLRFVVDKPPETNQAFCDQIEFRFDVDGSPCTRPSYLATDSGEQTVTPLEWDSLDPHDAGVFTFLPKGKDEVTKSYTFDIFAIEVSTLVGTATVKVTERSTDHDDAHCPNDDHDQCYQNRSVSFDVPKFPAGFTEADFKPDKTEVAPGGDVTVQWNVETVARYQLLRGNDPIDPAQFSRTTIDDVTTWSYVAHGITDNTVFTLRVGYEDAETTVKREYYVPVDVRRPTLNLLVVGNRTMIHSGEKVTLKFDVAHVNGCSLYAEVADGIPHLVKAIAGLPSWDVSPVHTTEYFLRGTNDDGEGVTSSPVTIYVVPSAPAMTADLLLIKTKQTSGTVELHFGDGASGFQTTTSVATSFDAAQGPNGAWTMIQDSGGWMTHGLVFIKTRNTDGLMTEIHIAPANGGYTGGGKNELTSLSEPQAAHGTVTMAQLGSEKYLHLEEPPRFIFIKTSGTGGFVEVHCPKWPDWLGEPGRSWKSAYPVADRPEATWLMADMAGYGGQLDLVLVDVQESSGSVELSYATGASGYQKKGKTWVTGFDAGDASDGTWLLADMDGDGKIDLVFVKTANTVSGRVEVYYASQADGFQKLAGGYTAFDAAEGGNGTWQIVPAGSR